MAKGHERERELVTEGKGAGGGGAGRWGGAAVLTWVRWGLGLNPHWLQTLL